MNVATKSGTNIFRGTGYEFFRNEKLATNTPDNNANDIEKGKFKRNQTGFSFGGPIVKDKLHFFSSLEYIRVRSTDTVISLGADAAVPRGQPRRDAGVLRRLRQAASTINGPVLTRADVSAIVGTGAGAFNVLPADLPVFGRVEKSRCRSTPAAATRRTTTSGSNRVDFSAGPEHAGCTSVTRYQNQEAEPGTNSSSPYDGFDTGYMNKNHNILGSFTHVFSPTFTSQTKVVWNRLYDEQPLNGDPPADALHEPDDARCVCRATASRSRAICPWNPGNAIPFGGPQKLLQLYQDQTWLKGKHDFRFGGSYVHIDDDHTFGATRTRSRR